ncbi:MAG: hypothetical protein QXN08_02805 [Nitrososphaerales archaeon]
MSSEVSELERRIKSIEKEIQEIREPLYTTLTDLRSTIAELENPFNYISKMIDSIDLKEKKKEGKEAIGSIKVGEAKDNNKDGGLDVSAKESSSSTNLHTGFKMDSEQWYYQFNVLVVSNLLLEIFEKDELKKVLAEYVKDGWVSRELAKTIEEAVDKLTVNRKVSQIDNEVLESHLFALYILYKLSNQPNDPVLPFLLILLNRLRRANNAIK